MTRRLMIFWDYDTQWGADRSRSTGGPKDWGRMEFENTERLLELHAFFSVPACFAVVGAAALPGERPYHDPNQIRRIAQMGHEVASHSMHHEWLPALSKNHLFQTLRQSKDALEQCLGKPVVSFVPPYNQPFDFPSRLSISLSERREVQVDRTDIPRMCAGLREAGYLFTRISYHPVYERIWRMGFGKQNGRLSKLERVKDVTCIRLKMRGGFPGEALAFLANSTANTSILVAYGHPHALHSGNAQDERYLIPFLEQVQQLVAAGELKIVLPRLLVHSHSSWNKA